MSVSLQTAFRSVALTVMLVPLAVSCGQHPREVRQQQGAERPPVTVGVTRAVSIKDAATASYVGTVRSSRSTVVSPRYPGTVVGVNVSRGSVVKAGDVLAEISSEGLISTRDAAEATFRQAEDALARVEKMRAAGGVADVKYVDVKTQFEKALSAFRASQKAVDDCTLKAPFGGVVENLYASAGEEAGLASPLMTIVSTDDLEIEISVPESEIAGIAKGQRFSVRVPALGGACFMARAASSGASASPLSHSYSCMLKPEPEVNGLLPGMVCSVSTARGNASSLVIPADVVRTDGQGRFVWCVEDGIACKRHIVTDGYASGGIRVSSGLDEGALIVTAGARKISGGMRVNIAEDGR